MDQKAAYGYDPEGGPPAYPGAPTPMYSTPAYGGGPAGQPQQPPLPYAGQPYAGGGAPQPIYNTGGYPGAYGQQQQIAVMQTTTTSTPIILGSSYAPLPNAQAKPLIMQLTILRCLAMLLAVGAGVASCIPNGYIIAVWPAVLNFLTSFYLLTAMVHTSLRGLVYYNRQSILGLDLLAAILVTVAGIAVAYDTNWIRVYDGTISIQLIVSAGLDFLCVLMILPVLNVTRNVIVMQTTTVM